MMKMTEVLAFLKQHKAEAIAAGAATVLGLPMIGVAATTAGAHYVKKGLEKKPVDKKTAATKKSTGKKLATKTGKKR